MEGVKAFFAYLTVPAHTVVRLVAAHPKTALALWGVSLVLAVRYL
jgi:hypothetical protein